VELSAATEVAYEMTCRLTLEAGVAEAIRAHGRDAYPYECCGALIGRPGLAVEACALPNSTEEGPRRRFLVRPSDYRTAEARASEQGLALLGFYHSHPDQFARPSQYDLDHAWPVFSYIILSVAGGSPADMTSWRLSDDRTRFDEQPLEVAAGAPSLNA